jgi:hypothetical protein
VNLGLRNKAGEAVDVQESIDFRHPRIVTIFPTRKKASFTEKIRTRLATGVEIHPLDSTKSQILNAVASSIWRSQRYEGDQDQLDTDLKEQYGLPAAAEILKLASRRIVPVFSLSKMAYVDRVPRELPAPPPPNQAPADERAEPEGD